MLKNHLIVQRFRHLNQISIFLCYLKNENLKFSKFVLTIVLTMVLTIVLSMILTMVLTMVRTIIIDILNSVAISAKKTLTFRIEKFQTKNESSI